MDEKDRLSQIDNGWREIEYARTFHVEQLKGIEFSNESAVGFAASATKAFLLINGGAAVAMLGFVATLASQQGAVSINIAASIAALVWFASGVLAAAACSGLAYIVMYLQAVTLNQVKFKLKHPYVEKTSASKWAIGFVILFHIAAVFVGVASLLFFWFGVMDFTDVINGDLETSLTNPK